MLKKGDAIYIRIEPELKNEIKKKAESEYMNMSAYILMAVRNEMKRKKK